VVEIAVWMRAHHERNLWFGEPEFSAYSGRIELAASLRGAPKGRRSNPDSRAIRSWIASLRSQ
jgi:hypothetical protein